MLIHSTVVVFPNKINSYVYIYCNHWIYKPDYIKLNYLSLGPHVFFCIAILDGAGICPWETSCTSPEGFSSENIYCNHTSADKWLKYIIVRQLSTLVHHVSIIIRPWKTVIYNHNLWSLKNKKTCLRWSHHPTSLFLFNRFFLKIELHCSLCDAFKRLWPE